MSCRISTETTRRGRAVLRLHDDRTGATAAVLPSYGFNLFDLRLPAGGRVRTIGVAEPDWAEDPRKPGRNGFPVLFPFPNRIRDGRFTFGGKDYQLPRNKPPHAIHGFAIEADWDVVDHGVDDAGAFVIGRFQISRQAPEALADWPADAILELRYTLAGRRLTFDITVTNPSAGPLPYGFGIHPYFRLPLAADGDPERTSLTLPAAETWVLRDSLPTGERRPVDERLDFRVGKPIDGLALDDVLTGLTRDDDGWGRARLRDLALDAEVRLEFDRAFRELVVFTPPGPGGVIAIEPYTQTTDAINLQSRGIDAGLRVLGPGQSERMGLRVEVSGEK